jgi:single-stranded-DNA-specific exonuclease
MKWKLNNLTDEYITEIANKLNTNPLLVKILLNRGLTVEQADILLNRLEDAIIDPALLTNATEAASIIAHYCRIEDANIHIFADYDADGITAGYIMTSALKEVANARIHVYYPERSEGYGLSMEYCKNLVKNKQNDHTLLITVDNGITKTDEVKYLKNNGIEVVVTDHHVAKEQVPDCTIVDPWNNGESDTFKHLAGCGVAFKVAELVQNIMYHSSFKKKVRLGNMLKYTYAVAIGTMADIMPLAPENIALIQYGMMIMNSKECPAGIKAIKEYIGKSKITSEDLIWNIAPRINACGRMGDIKLAAQLFFTEWLETPSEIDDVVNAIERMNLVRKELSKQAKKEIEEYEVSDDENVCIIDATGYSEGLIGTIAGDVAKRFNRPAIVYTKKDGNLHGSARSVDGINLQELFQQELEAGTIVQFGGHEAAAGVTFMEDKLDDLKNNLNKKIQDIIESSTDNVEQELIIDEAIDINGINEQTYNLINTLIYDNRSFTNPVFQLNSVEVVEAKPVKTNPVNMWLTIKDHKKVITLKTKTDIYKALGEPKRINIAGYIKSNFMYGKRKGEPKVILEILDLIGA